jgi:hypothetical protein
MDLMPYVRRWLSPGFRRSLLNILAVPFRSLRNTRDIIDTMSRSGLKIYERKKAAAENKLADPDIGSDIYSMLGKLLCLALLYNHTSRLQFSEIEQPGPGG